MGSTRNLGMALKLEDVFLEEDYGKPISERLSEILRRNLSKNDYANIAIRTNVSFSTIRDVVYRTNSLTKANAKAILLLISMQHSKIPSLINCKRRGISSFWTSF